MNKLMEHGQERTFYGKESAGPGAYNTPEVIASSRYSIPKSNRGLLLAKYEKA